MSERDYPKGHPAASDYAGEPYTPPRAPFSEDFGPDHPARMGKNTSLLDTPDGLRKHTVELHQHNARVTKGALELASAKAKAAQESEGN